MQTGLWAGRSLPGSNTKSNKTTTWSNFTIVAKYDDAHLVFAPSGGKSVLAESTRRILHWPDKRWSDLVFLTLLLAEQDGALLGEMTPTQLLHPNDIGGNHQVDLEMRTARTSWCSVTT